MHQSPSPASSLPQEREATPEYRKAKPLPVQLLDHCTVCFEEQLYPQAFSLLSSALQSGTNSPVEAPLPPPQHLALAATLTVHPQLTSRTTSPDKHAAADDALSYLRHVNALLGPQNAGLGQVFQFNSSSSASSSRLKRVRTRFSEMASDDEDDARPGHIRSSYVSKDSLWNNADDFWDVVGWAFNCSVSHRHRWDRWKLWLDFMLDVLTDDLQARTPDAVKTYESGGTSAVEALLRESLLAQYLSSIGYGRNNKRRLMRAIFANGTPKSLAEFGEIWRHETKAPRRQEEEPARKRRKLDLENGDFGDYFDESDEESPASSVRRSRSVTAFSAAAHNNRSRAVSEDEDEDENAGDDDSTDNAKASDASTSNSTSPPGIKAYGGMDSICLRQRFLALLAHFCAINPAAFLDLEDLFDLYTEFLRPLPLPVFQHFVLPTTPYLTPNNIQQQQASLNKMLLRPLLAATAPAYSENAVTQAEFETYYAPHAANNAGAVDNAKVGLLVESLLRMLWNCGAMMAMTKRLRVLVQRGIDERRGKVVLDGRRKVGVRFKEHEDALMVMECSAERMLMILDMMT